MILTGILTGFICFVLYQLAMLLSDSRSVVRDTDETVKELNKVVKDVNEIVGTVKGTVYQVNDAILIPLKRISTVLSVVSGISEGIASRKGK